jgi:glutamate N-acetyltransferase/amino-acid N-acetyltransferase
MIHPHMATMLAFVATEAAFSPAELQRRLPALAAQSFNALHVDTHPSTNDTLILLATGRKKVRGVENTGKVVKALGQTAQRLAWLIARDGEGATKVTTIEVCGAGSDSAAREIAVLLASSALVRTALYGNDPNWGRFVSQVGNSSAVKSVRGLVCKLQGFTVFKNGEPTRFDRAAASRAMKSEDVRLIIQLREGRGHAILMTSDLGYKYIEINAEYTT